ncbi:MAG TPA: hypothetical protein VLT87_01055 [Thermoanaerobaculia bacterium]|nr:hypothetical protein [Thermoanaerobaculia bacterium]
MRWWQTLAAVPLTLALAGAQALAAPQGAPAGAEKPATPRELSDAEIAAVQLAAAYLQRGPAAWWERLAADAPLRRVGREAALAEIAIRSGPAEGATWQLLTPGPSFDRQTAVFGVELASGLDETLILRLVEENGWKIAEVRASFDPVETGSQPSRPPAAVSPPPAPERASPAKTSGGMPASLFGLALAGALGVTLLPLGKRRFAAIAAGAAAVLVGLGVSLWSFRGSPPAPRPPAPRAGSPAADPGLLRLGALAPLRAALAAGNDSAEIARRLAAPLEDPRLQEVRELWRAHSLFEKDDLDAAEAILDRFPTPARHPLAELLRARLSFRRLERQETGWSYEQAIRRGLDHDGLRLESALAKAMTTEGDLAEKEIVELVEMGSRLPDPWYAAAQIAVTKGRMDEAEALLRSAWRLTPSPREELFGNAILAFLVARPSLFPLFRLEDPEEPCPPPEGVLRPLVLPAGASAATCGQSLRLGLSGAELLVPGGAGLAPAGAVLEDAEAWSLHAEEKALATLPSFADAPKDAAWGPGRLRLAEQVAQALAGRNRWSELIHLTEPVAAAPEHAPATLLRLRAQALRQMEREAEARQLLIRLAKIHLASRRPNPGTLFDLSELLAAAGEYDTAIRLSRMADAQMPEPRGERRRQQLALDGELAASYATYRSEHFEVRYPQKTGETYARGVAQVLEEERRRLAHWIPKTGTKPIEVHLFPIRTFVSTFGSGDIAVVGLFDGKMRIPFAEIRSLHPRLVAILSHELAHALIAAATRDQAPHWLQEGLAQHIEMGTEHRNPLPGLVRDRRALAFPAIDPVLRGFAEPQLVELAYSEAAWAVHFIEARFGVEAIHRLLDAFAAGSTTEQAIRTACGVSPAELDRALWQWGTSEAPSSRLLAARRYDVEYNVQLIREQKKGVEEILRVGISEEGRAALARHKEEADETRKKMTAWHAAYTAKAADVKRALKPIVSVYRNGGREDVVPACTALSASASRLLDDPEPWASPDPQLNETLRTAYKILTDLGDSCSSAGRGHEVRFLLAEADRFLAAAARHLAPYGLHP